MSWTQYFELIKAGKTDPAQWEFAKKSNPNDPASALRLAILKIYEQQDPIALDMLCHILIEFANTAYRKTNLENFAKELIEKFQNDGELFFGNEISEDILPIAQKHHLAVRRPYNPQKHGTELMEICEPGDMLWFWTMPPAQRIES